MNRQHWKDVAEAIGFVAIIASLVFVGIETRNSTKQSELKIWDGETTDIEDFQLNRGLYILFRHGDLAYFMYERGAIDEARLESALAPVPIYSDAGRNFWETRKALSLRITGHILTG